MATHPSPLLLLVLELHNCFTGALAFADGKVNMVCVFTSALSQVKTQLEEEMPETFMLPEKYWTSFQMKRVKEPVTQSPDHTTSSAFVKKLDYNGFL